MRISILGSRGYPSTYGGFETLIRRLAPYLVSQGHCVTVYCREPFEGQREWLTPQGVRCVFTSGSDRPSASTLTYGATSSVHALTLGRPDVALILNVANGYYLPAFKARGIPTVVNTDGIEWERAKWGQLAQRVFVGGARLSSKYADQRIYDSQHIATYWAKRWGAPGRFIAYGADVLNVGSDRLLALDLKPREYVLAVARLVPENNVDLFLDAVASSDAIEKVVVVGDTQYPTLLRDRLAKVSRDRVQVTWLGHVADQELLAQLWGNCAIYFHGHSVGGTNPALLQALGYGSPTVAIDTPYNAEVLGSGAVLVEPSVPAVREALEQLLNNPARADELSVAGQLTVQARYQWDQIVAEYETCLIETAERRRC